MAEVLVLVEHAEGNLKNVTGELITAARALGEPSAVVIGAPGTADKLTDALKALGAAKGSADALRMVPGLDVKVLDAGCCGMAGAFGYEKDHYDVSVAVANLELIPSLNANPDAVVVATGTSCRHQIRDLTGREALADEVQKLYLEGEKDRAVALIPDELVDDMHIIGTASEVKERAAQWEETGVTTLMLSFRGPDEIRTVAELLS